MFAWPPISTAKEVHERTGGSTGATTARACRKQGVQLAEVGRGNANDFISIRPHRSVDILVRARSPSGARFRRDVLDELRGLDPASHELSDDFRDFVQVGGSTHRSRSAAVDVSADSPTPERRGRVDPRRLHGLSWSHLLEPAVSPRWLCSRRILSTSHWTHGQPTWCVDCDDTRLPPPEARWQGGARRVRRKM